MKDLKMGAIENLKMKEFENLKIEQFGNLKIMLSIFKSFNLQMFN